MTRLAGRVAGDYPVGEDVPNTVFLLRLGELGLLVKRISRMPAGIGLGGVSLPSDPVLLADGGKRLHVSTDLPSCRQLIKHRV